MSCAFGNPPRTFDCVVCECRLETSLSEQERVKGKKKKLHNRRHKMAERESRLPFCFPSVYSESILSHLQTTIHPQTQGDHIGVIFQSSPCSPPAEGPRLRFKGRWETSEAPFSLYSPPCRLPPRGQPFEGVITAACITWVTADGGWSQLLEPFKEPPLSCFLLELESTAPLPDNCRRGPAF